jgi:succinate dehydrogenase / fumarate reductase cytochrome b subunit
VKALSVKPLGTSTGTKILIAVTGLALFAYLPIHLAGNLLVFAGRDTFNKYSHLLVSNPLIYVMEAGLLAIFLLHIYKAVTNFAANRKARPQPYLKKEWAGYKSRKSPASATMIWTGVWTLLFIAVHLQGIKFGAHYEMAGEPGHVRDLYRTQFEVLTNPLNAAFYLVSMGIIGFHLWHGFWSAWQSLGLGSSRYTPRLVAVSKAFAVLLSGGFIFIVLCVFLGLFVQRVTP